jgi:uncharacterized protein (DUF58 family)
MRPQLAPRGIWFASAGLLLLVVGAAAESAPLCALGFAALGALLAAWVRFAPRTLEIFSGGIKLAWWLEPEAGAPRTLVVGRPMLLRAALRCHGKTPLGLARLTPVAHPALDVRGELVARVSPASEVRLDAHVVPRAAGTHLLHGATLDVFDPLGLFRVQAYFPTPLRIAVLPRAMALAPPTLSGAVLAQERAGRRLAKRAGMGDELREIREHAHGDPWKRIAWAATARTGQLMVRDFEMDTTWNYHIVVDATAAARRGAPGETALDAAIEGATALARAAVAQGDRVALTVFGPRLIAAVPAGDGPAHLVRVVGALLEAVRPVDDDLTDITEGELAAAVARYLRHQEGTETQLDRVPALDDPAWSRIVTGPRGDLYDLHALGRSCRTLLPAKDAPVKAADPDLAALRRFCRLRAIDLPPRALGARDHATAVAHALAQAALPRTARTIVLFSPLGKELEDAPARWHEPLERTLGLLRRRRHRLTVVVPAAAEPPPESPDAAALNLWVRADRARAEEAARRLRTLGATAVVAAVNESPGSFLTRKADSIRFSVPQGGTTTYGDDHHRGMHQLRGL